MSDEDKLSRGNLSRAGRSRRPGRGGWLLLGFFLAGCATEGGGPGGYEGAPLARQERVIPAPEASPRAGAERMRPIGGGPSLFGRSFPGVRVAVVFQTKEGGEALGAAAESVTVSALLQDGFTVLDQATLAQLKKDAILRAAIENRSASAFLEIKQKYQTGLIVHGHVSADSAPGIGIQWIGTANASLSAAVTETAEVIGTATSRPMGTVGNPSVVADTPLGAREKAVRKALEGTLVRMGLSPEQVADAPVQLSYRLLFQSEPLGAVALQVAFSPDGQHLAAGTGDGQVRAWNIQSRAPWGGWRGHSGQVTALAFSQDGRWLGSGSDDGTVRLWDFQGRREGPAFRGMGRIYSLAISPDGQLLAAGDGAGTIYFWDLSAGAPQGRLGAHTKKVHSLSFDRSGRNLISAGEDLFIKFWDLGRPDRPRRIIKEDFGTHPFRLGQLLSASFSPDGEVVALGIKEIAINLLTKRRTDTEYIRLISAVTGDELHRFEGHQEAILSLSFGPSRRFLASGAHDGMVKVWDAERAMNLITISLGRDVKVGSVSFSRDGTLLAAASGDRATVWALK